MLPRSIRLFKYLNQFGTRSLWSYAAYQLGLRTGKYKRLENREQKNREQKNTALISAPLFSLPSRESLLQTLGDHGKAVLLSEADEIVAGKLRMFGGEPVPIQLTFDQPLGHWTEYELNVELLSVLSSHTDIKFIWEPARFGWAIVLGRAFYITQENKYAESFWKLFETFIGSNPVNRGPNWMNGQEVAIRLIALTWAAHLFEAAPASGPERIANLHQSIYTHAIRIPLTLNYARAQNNNHLITESAAIYTAGLLFKNPEWRALGWKWFNRGVQSQISGYGEYVQHSTNYHRLMLQTALWINLIKQDVFSTGTSQALARASHWLFSLLEDSSGRTPNLGANDGALILPLSAAAFDDYRPTVQAAARAFLRSGLTPGMWDEMSLWLGLRANTREADSSAYLAENLRAKNSWAYLRASSFKSPLGHMDQLHLDLWWRGLNIAQDAGSYLYNAQTPWDNSLISTRVHNTVMVDDREQMTRASKFLVLDWEDAFEKPLIELDEKILHKIKATFNGYRKLGVRHERTVTLYDDEFWEVQDRLLSSRRRLHTYRLHWLLIDGAWTIDAVTAGIQLHIKTEHGEVTLLVRHPQNIESRYSLVRAGELLRGKRELHPYEGWISRRYGEKSPALSFVVEVTSPYHTVITSEFTFPE